MLIYNVCWEQGLVQPPTVLLGAPGPLLTPSIPCSAWVWTNPLSSQMPRKQSCACARTHIHTHITAWEIPTSGSHVTELCPESRSREGLEDREDGVNPSAPQYRGCG